MSQIVETMKEAAKSDAARITAQVIVTAAALVATHIVIKKIETK